MKLELGFPRGNAFAWRIRASFGTVGIESIRTRDSAADRHLIASTKSGSCLVTLNEAVDGSVVRGARWYQPGLK